MTKLTANQVAEIERWATVLESDKYRQCDGILRRDDGSFCCLGVYADNCGAEWRETSDMERAPFVEGKQVGGVGGDELLDTNWLKERTGISTQSELTTANDSGVDFKRIAAGLRKFAETGKMPKDLEEWG